ncbi:MAG: hypothetical protein M3O34_15040 [Chloroflexota bacterium]|nr:hypothetical protein [Chloroflexota bacterium]
MSFAVTSPDSHAASGSVTSMSVEIGPLKLRGPLGILGSLLIGLIVGTSVMSYIVFERRQPAGLIQWLVHEEVAKGNGIRPEVSLTVNDVATGTRLAPQNKTYVVKPGQVLRVQSQPEPGPFSWTVVPPGYGTYESRNEHESVVYLVAPTLAEGEKERVGAVLSCSIGRECSEPVLITTKADAR